MGWHYPEVSWTELERLLSQGALSAEDISKLEDSLKSEGIDLGQFQNLVHEEVSSTRELRTKYAELHCHSHFSFLDGASSPQALVEEAVIQGLDALAITDHNGFYGVVKFAEAAKAYGLPTIYGAELTLGLTEEQIARKDPSGQHLLVLARNPDGYAALSRIITESQMRGTKGSPRLNVEQIAGSLIDDDKNNLVFLTGCRKGIVPAALNEGVDKAEQKLAHLIELFGKDNVVVELWDHNNPQDCERNDELYELAQTYDLTHVATNNVHYANYSYAQLASSISAIRSRSSLESALPWMAAAPASFIRSGNEQARRFVRYPGAVQNAYDLGMSCAFDLSLIAPKLPPFKPGKHYEQEVLVESEIEFLRNLAEQGATRMYGKRSDPDAVKAWQQIDYELNIIEELGFAGYFLIVWDIVEFCNSNDIYCQGRGSAANSAVCYVLGVTRADAVGLGLLFERFLSAAREGPPDIDIDIESGRREEAIQYVYNKYGRTHAAQVANVISYQARSAVRDASKALGYSVGQQDAFSKAVSHFRSEEQPGSKADQTYSAQHKQQVQNQMSIPVDVANLAGQFQQLPRHLGIHTGGMVICDRPIIEVCPVERARMNKRTVLQWDKDDCAAAGLVKFDLLGLGMLSAVHETVDQIELMLDEVVDLALIDQEDAVYDMLCRADTIGIFQVESRAQMSTLPRLKPRTFYDLVVEIALIRPGPIQGGSVHPYIRRRNGEEEVTYLHPLMKPALEKTLGVPLFQEQMMQLAIDVASFSAQDADQLRQAMAAKRSQERMNTLKSRFYAGMEANGIADEIKHEIWAKLAAFANFGFPESHSISFAYLVYSSSWLKLHYPAAFCVGLLNSQPMGFYSPHSLIQDARRHGVVSFGPCINKSLPKAGLEQTNEWTPMTPPVGVDAKSDVIGQFNKARRDKGLGVRLGLTSINQVSEELADTIVANSPYESIEDFIRKTKLNSKMNIGVLENLAQAGAFDSIEENRRDALWKVGALQHVSDQTLEGIVTGLDVPELSNQTGEDIAYADLTTTGIAINGHPTVFIRDELTKSGVVEVADLTTLDSEKVKVAGIVTHKQRPPTAHGVTFMTLEDETGLANIVVSPGCWKRYNDVLVDNPGLIIKGRIERKESVINLIAEKFEGLNLKTVPASRDYR